VTAFSNISARRHTYCSKYWTSWKEPKNQPYCSALGSLGKKI